MNDFDLRTIYAQAILSPMAWLQKRGGIWWIGWRISGKEFRQSTGETDRSLVGKTLRKQNLLETARAQNALTEEFYKSATGRTLPKATVSDFMTAWLKESESETTRSTMNKYRQVVREFSSFVEADSTGLLLEEVSVAQVTGFFTEKSTHLAPGTVKGYRRILGSIFLLAQNRGLLKANPVAASKARGRRSAEAASQKRPFTLVELKTLFDRATPFWQYMITAGYFTGQSLGDLITLRAENLSLPQNQITMVRRKTDKQVIIPLAAPLHELLVSIWPEGGRGYFWPDQAARYLKSGASSFSQEFYELLAGVGLVRQRKEGKQSRSKGRITKREHQKIGFHNLRHTFVTSLKIGGAMDSVAKELAGHSSNAVSAVYTHLPPETLSKAINQLPEFIT